MFGIPSILVFPWKYQDRAAANLERELAWRVTTSRRRRRQRNAPACAWAHCRKVRGSRPVRSRTVGLGLAQGTSGLETARIVASGSLWPSLLLRTNSRTTSMCSWRKATPGGVHRRPWRSEEVAGLRWITGDMNEQKCLVHTVAVPAAAFFGADAAYRTVFSPSLTISAAGLFAFFAGDISNSYVLAKLKLWDRGKRLWLRFVSSTIVGEGVNTSLFYGIALHSVLPQRLLLRGVLMVGP
jgi:Putative vitamin uptake transporter